MPNRLVLKLLPGLLLALALAGTALAGGVVVSLDTPLPQPNAGQAFSIEFTIRSAHDGSLQGGLTPFITATDAQTGEALTFEAGALQDTGRYAATIVLPTAGEWAWQIHPTVDYPHEMIAVMPPIQVQPAALPAPSPAALAPSLLWVAAMAVLLLALGVGLAARRRAVAQVS
jgi:hypothetical protein